MCTVTYVPKFDGCIITSNRDEKIARERALSPQKYTINDKSFIFPKDPKAGGTWIAHNENKIIVLLNGAEEKHIPKPSYRKSRGLIVLDLMTAENTFNFWKTIDLENIEPFTIVLFEENKLVELQWNEVDKKTTILNKQEFHIWSSATLYSKEIREQRKNWFNQFIKTEKKISPEQIFNFHQFTEANNKEFGLQINRNDMLKTISITQCVVSENQIQMSYLDLL